ncbi:MAG: tetratricopeptide repeat protein, partial [Candidatus Methylomirabilales bacterium]
SGVPLAVLTRHLEGCPACAAEWAVFQKATQAVAGLGRAEPSPGFATRVRQRLEAPSRGRRVVEWLFVPLRVKVPIQAMALVLVAFAGLLIYQRTPEMRWEAGSRAAPATPTPSAPQAAGEPARGREADELRAGSPEAEQAQRQTRPSGPAAQPPQPALKAAKERTPAPLGKEAESLKKPVGESESSEAAAPPRESRAKREESAAPGRTLQPPASAPSQPSGVAREGHLSSARTGSADELYASALEDAKSNRYDQAIEGLRAFIAEHPRDNRAPDARLGLADAYFAQQRYPEAISEYETLTREFPDSPLLPAALYRQGQARLALGDRTGCQVLRDVADRYPQAPEATLALET